MEESFEDNNTNSLPVHYTTVQHSVENSVIASIPSLSIVSDDQPTVLSGDHHALSSRDTNKMVAITVPRQYSRPPVVTSSLVDPVLQNRFSKYLNGSFDSTLGYTTTDVTSDTDSIDHVTKHPPAENAHKVTHGRLHSDVRMLDKRTQAVTQKGTRGVTNKETQKSTELDNLWKQFVASPLYTDWVRSKRSPDTKTGMCYCEELKQLEYKSRHCTKLPVKAQVTTHRDHTTCGNTNVSDDSNTTLYTDTAVQTSPSLLTATTSTDTRDAVLTDCPCTSSHVIKGSPPSSDSSFSDQVSGEVTGSYDFTGSCEQPASLTKLSLQEACRLFKKDFITNSRQRQRMIHRTRKQREEELVTSKHQAALADLARQYKSHQNGEHLLEYTRVNVRIIHKNTLGLKDV